jgi:hypothetical protein
MLHFGIGGWAKTALNTGHFFNKQCQVILGTADNINRGKFRLRFGGEKSTARGECDGSSGN